MTRPHRPAHLISVLALAGCATLAGTAAEASLVARNLDGDASTAEAYYDTTLGITWLRDAARLNTVYGGNVLNDHATTTSALAAFNADNLVNYGHSGWRLPGAAGVHTLGGAGCQTGFNGSTDCGENVDTASSELASMFHDTLGNLSWRDTAGNVRAGAQGVDWGLVNEADFIHLDAANYWSGTASYRLIFGLQQQGQVSFQMANGTQAITVPGGLGGAWLVHDGDIGGAVTAAVPVPGSLALAALGLVLLARHRAA